MYAVIKDNKVTSMVRSEKPVGVNLEGCELVESEVDVVGCTYTGGEFVRMYTDAERAAAYADVLTGSDRLFQSYQAALATDSADADSKKAAWLARRAEIQAEYPLEGE